MKASVNGIEMYYEVKGEGKPVILVHGNGEDHDIFSVVTEELSKDHKVYAPDSRCHGHSTYVPGPVSYSTLADDCIAFIKALNIDKPVFYGFSDGGIIGLMIAVREPDLLGKLIVSGANIDPDGLEWGRGEREWIEHNGTELEKMMIREPHMTPEELSRITVPTVVLAGENDCILREHTELIAASIPGSILEIVPGECHESYIINSPKLYPILKKYL